jgi:hypothetical protein
MLHPTIGRRTILTIAIVAGLLLPPVAFADQCSAGATAGAPKLIQSNNYLFMFDVHSDACTKYACRGFVKFVIQYHNQGAVVSVKDRTLVGYTIKVGNSQVHVSLQHYVGVLGSNPSIDDVGVEEMT